MTTEAIAISTANWTIRAEAPVYLDAIGLTAEAAALRALPEIVDASSALAAWPPVERAFAAARSANDRSPYGGPAGSIARSVVSREAAWSVPTASGCCLIGDIPDALAPVRGVTWQASGIAGHAMLALIGRAAAGHDDDIEGAKAAARRAVAPLVEQLGGSMPMFITNGLGETIADGHRGSAEEARGIAQRQANRRGGAVYLRSNDGTAVEKFEPVSATDAP